MSLRIIENGKLKMKRNPFKIGQKEYNTITILYSADELNERIKQFEQNEASGKMKYYTSEQLRKHVI